MTQWTEEEKADIRAYIGAPALFHQFEPRFENAMNSVQAIADGGVLPSNATQERMRRVLAELATVDCQLNNTQKYAHALSVDGNDIVVDYVRANFLLMITGRRLITQLCIPLGLNGPFRDYYSGLPLNNTFGGNSPFPISG